MSATETIATPDERLFPAILAKVDQIKAQHSPNRGSFRGICYFDKIGKSAATILKVTELDGMESVFFVEAMCGGPAVIHGTEVRFKVTESSSDSPDFWGPRVAEVAADAAKPENERRIAIVDHWFYGIGREPRPGESRDCLGFAGRKHRIVFQDGRDVTTHNLWSGGIIPPTFWDRLPDNATFL